MESSQTTCWRFPSVRASAVVLALTPTSGAPAAAGGLVVAGLMAALSRVWVDRRTARRDARRTHERAAAQLRLAVRLVVEELFEAERMIRGAAKTGCYWRVQRELSTAVWKEHAGTLAVQISGPADWQGVTPAFKELDRLNRLVSERRRRVGIGIEVPVEAEDETLAAWHEVQRAIWGLEASIHMAEDIPSWLAQLKRLEQAHWGHQLRW